MKSQQLRAVEKNTPLPSTAPHLEVDIDAGTGRVELAHEPALLFDVGSWAAAREELMDTAGAEYARRFLTRLGYVCGQADARRVRAAFPEESQRELILLGPAVHAQRGCAWVETESLTIDPDSDAFQMSGRWRHSGIAERHIETRGVSTNPVCWELAGYASGYASEILGAAVLFVEDSCVACERSSCHFSGRTVEAWGAEAEAHLPYFQAIRLGDEHSAAKIELDDLKAKLKCGCSFEDVVVESPAMLEAIQLACKVAPTEATVLITGESGTGKELMARAIHNNSARSRGPFIAVNCAALPEQLLEDELFGHERGAFTGAERRRAGRFELAKHGTLFLDEIGEIAPAVQVKLLRVLQERTFERLGGVETQAADVRVIAATNRDLSSEMEEGRFRDDLYYRLNVFHIKLSPLRERPEDIPKLARSILEKLANELGRRDLSLSHAALETLQAYEWRGNVRELQNALERAAILCDTGLIRPEHLPIQRSAAPRLRSSDDELAVHLGPGFSLRGLEQELVQRALRIAGGNQSEAARLLGLSRGAFRARLGKTAK